MSEYTNHRQSDNIQEKDKRSLVQKYLQNPFSVARSKLAELFYPDISLDKSTEEVQPDNSYQPYELNSICDRSLYPRFTDRVDPSLYYTVFFPHNRES